VGSVVIFGREGGEEKEEGKTQRQPQPTKPNKKAIGSVWGEEGIPNNNFPGG